MFKIFTKQLYESKQAKKPLSLIIMDVDDFKKFNYTYGYPEGDVILKSLANLITSLIREFDTASIYGGGEFTIILPNTNIDDAFQVAERIQNDFSSRIFQPEKGAKVSVSVSIGIALYKYGEHPDSLIKRADKALYNAKLQGKNKTKVAY